MLFRSSEVSRKNMHAVFRQSSYQRFKIGMCWVFKDGLLFVVEVGSSLLQIVSKKLFNRRIFISAPLHHHLEAKGWPEVKVTMRFWVIACVMAFVGFVLALAGGHIA